MEINHYFVLDLDMYCYDCEENNNDDVIYTCEYCDQDICQKCIKKDDYILCGPCSEQFLTNLIRKEDIDNNKRLIQCNNCGNRWDGNAQCNCYLYLDYDESNFTNNYEVEETDEEIDSE